MILSHNLPLLVDETFTWETIIMMKRRMRQRSIWCYWFLFVSQLATDWRGAVFLKIVLLLMTLRLIAITGAVELRSNIRCFWFSVGIHELELEERIRAGGRCWIVRFGGSGVGKLGIARVESLGRFLFMRRMEGLYGVGLYGIWLLRFRCATFRQDRRSWRFSYASLSLSDGRDWIDWEWRA